MDTRDNDRVRINGEGPPLLLIHGLGSPHEWDRTIDELAARFRVIVPVLPGFFPGDDLVDYSDELYVEYLESLRQQLSVETWAIAGISAGGRHALDYALAHQDRVDCLIAIAPAGMCDIHWAYTLPGAGSWLPPVLSRMTANPKQLRSVLDTGDWVEADGSFSDWAWGGFADRMAEPVFRTNFFRVGVGIGTDRKAKEWAKTLPELDVNVLVMWGAEDKMFPAKLAEDVSAMIPGSRVVVVEGCHHMVSMERPAVAVKEIVAFLAERQPAQVPVP